MVPRVIVFETATDGEPRLADVLRAGGCDVCAAATADALVDTVASGRQQAVLFALSPERPDDLVALRLLRRLAPDFPLVVVADDSSLEARRLLQAMRPLYFVTRPVDPDELLEAVRSVCGHVKRPESPLPPEPDPASPDHQRGPRAA